jgi:diguanylate cyclase (GGDEF)-like protein
MMIRQPGRLPWRTSARKRCPWSLRWDELVAPFPNQTTGTAFGGAERFRRSIETVRLSVPQGTERVTPSFGVADSQGHRSAEEVIQEADQALSAAKQGSRNRVEIFALGDVSSNQRPC